VGINKVGVQKFLEEEGINDELVGFFSKGQLISKQKLLIHNFSQKTNETHYPEYVLTFITQDSEFCSFFRRSYDSTISF
jgi:hypothetical protein